MPYAVVNMRSDTSFADATSAHIYGPILVPYAYMFAHMAAVTCMSAYHGCSRTSIDGGLGAVAKEYLGELVQCLLVFPARNEVYTNVHTG